MAGTIDRATLDRLIALGRVRGELTASEFQAALPVDTLDVDALVLVMLELEAAGISVEPDALGPRPETVASPTFTLAHRPPTRRRRRRPSAMATGLRPLRRPPPRGRPGRPRDRPGTTASGVWC